MRQDGVCDDLIQMITSGIVSTGQKTIPETPIMPILNRQNYGFTTVEVGGVKGGKNGTKCGL